MWQNFTVKNFRCFTNLSLHPLGRVNLIAGKNNTGKTALLEAMHLHAYPLDAALPFTINNLRGTPTESKSDQDACCWLHYDKDSKHEIELISQNDQGTTRTDRILVTDSATARTICPEIGKSLEGTLLQGSWEVGAPCVILRTEEKQVIRYSVGFPPGRGVPGYASIGSPSPRAGPSLFIGSAGRSQEEDIKAFSELEVANRQEEVLHNLQILEPRLRRLSVLLLSQKPALYGDIGLSRLVPLHFMGEGVRRLLSIVTAIAGALGGTVLVDEVENGFHHSVLQRVWQAIGTAARSANVQVFATTHSYECIQAAHQAFSSDNQYDLQLFRLDRSDSAVRATVYTQNTLNTSIDMSLEVR